MSFEQIERRADELIRAGKKAEARLFLGKLKGKKIPRPHISSIASLARRAGSIHLGLQIMNPIIRPKVELSQKATDEEMSAYVLLLLGIGATSEALELLGSANPENPEVRLATAFSHINRWDYSAAIPHLKSYLEVEVAPYKQLIAKVNLAASLVATGETTDGKHLLEEILEITKKNDWALLRKNAFEISAQCAIREMDWDRADTFLEQAAGSTDSEFTLDDLFVKKWQAISATLKDPQSVAAKQALQSVRTNAIKSNHWETVRDCDVHEALAGKNSDILTKVYFGSPHIPFRERLEKNCKSWMAVPDTYIWEMLGTQSSRTFDLLTAEEENGDARLKPGNALHVALQALTSDFYRPFLIGSLHGAVFPGEYFNPVSSPRRISFLIYRLRSWLKENKIPVLVSLSDAGYQLHAESPYAFRLKKSTQDLDHDSPTHYLRMLDKAQLQWRTGSFSVAEIASHFDISLRSARYFATWANKNDKMQKTGNGRSTRYQLNSRNKSS